jgi:methionyl-tRNA formyltransferase
MTSFPLPTGHSRRIALFANHLPGLEVARYLRFLDTPDQIVALFLCDQNPDVDKLILDECRLESDRVFVGKQDFSNPQVLDKFSKLNPDVIICVYWPWLLPEAVYSSCDITINFHPALLPANRGWYPHVHNLINGDSAGVTLHQLAPEADSGSVWAQKEVDVLSTDTAFDLYQRLQSEIVSLFTSKWLDIREGWLVPIAQSELSAIPSYNKKNALQEIDVIDLDGPTTARRLLNKLRARTFGNKGFAYFDDEQGRIYVRIELSHDSCFG